MRDWIIFCLPGVCTSVERRKVVKNSCGYWSRFISKKGCEVSHYLRLNGSSYRAVPPCVIGYDSSFDWKRCAVHERKTTAKSGGISVIPVVQSLRQKHFKAHTRSLPPAFSCDCRLSFVTGGFYCASHFSAVWTVVVVVHFFG